MAPQAVKTAIEDIEGVKRTRLINKGRDAEPRRVKVVHTRGRIPIDGRPFTLEPRFHNGRLAQVWLASPNQCGIEARVTYERISAGLKVKYPKVIYEADMDRSDILRAFRRSGESGAKIPISHIYANNEVVVLLSFALARETPPPHPGYGSKLASSLYQLARTQYEQRKMECAGRGHERMDIVLQYLSRSAFDVQAAATEQDLIAEQDELADQL